MLDSLPMSENQAYRVKRCCAKLLTHKSNFNRHLGARRIELPTRGPQVRCIHNGRVVLILNRIGKGSCETHGKRRRI
jgi:hypothetical protein